MKWKHALNEAHGYIQKGLQVYATGNQLYDVGKVMIPMLIERVYNHIRRAHHQGHRWVGQAYREARKYARGFDQFMNAAGRTVLTLQPLLDEIAPQTRKARTQGLECYDFVSSNDMGAHGQGQRLVHQLGKQNTRRN